MKVAVGFGSSTYFLKDLWLNNVDFAQAFPRRYSLSSRKVNFFLEARLLVYEKI